MRTFISFRLRLVVLSVSAVAAVAVAATLRSADHADAPLVQVDAAADINDVYAFLSPTDADRLVLVMTTNPFIPPPEVGTASFSSDVLYQIKIDTDGDAVENYVVQVTFAGNGADQNVTVLGPAQPAVVGETSRLLSGAPALTGRVSRGATADVFGNAQMEVFAGVRDDPFYFDGERLAEILAGQETSFRDPGIDLLAGMNTLAIVVEFPLTMIGNATNLGIWATTSTS